VTGLRELFEEVADSLPPSRLGAAEVFAAGRRQRRRRAATGGGAAALVLATLAAVGVTSLTSHETARPVPVSEGAVPAGTLHPGESISQFAAADTKHLYVTFSVCGQSPCDTRTGSSITENAAKVDFQLAGSDDGGRTWSDRGTPIEATRLRALGPHTLIAAAPGGIIDPTSSAQSSDGAGAAKSSWLVWMISKDGGRTWSRTASDSIPRDTVPAGGSVICWAKFLAESCTLHSVDLASGRLARLANQPGLTMDSDSVQIEQVGGRLWATGTDPQSGRPAVAVSADAGRTWQTHVFTESAVCTPKQCGALDLATADGRTVFVTITESDGRQRYLYRGTDAGSWPERVVPALARPVSGERLDSFMTNDGSLVLRQTVPVPGPGDDETVYLWALRTTGSGFGKAELEGLPSTVSPIRRASDGWLYTFDYLGGALYGSSDGWHWSALTRP
jgi:hypothetical protein